MMGDILVVWIDIHVAQTWGHSEVYTNSYIYNYR
jgi:hypothetical protein